MAKLKIVTTENPLIRKTSRAVDEITPRIITLLDDMRDTLIDACGVGLAAVQVGVLRRVVVVQKDDGEIIELINPSIIKTSGEQTGAEGCLSVPGKYGIVTRPMNVTVRATDRRGKTFEVEGTELIARAFCHEIDHLDGKIYTDIASEMFENEE